MCTTRWDVILLAGVGFKMDRTLGTLGVSTVAELRRRTLPELVGAFGDTLGKMLVALAQGKDASAVVQSGPPKSITCEDSFKSCPTLAAVDTVVRCLPAACVCAFLAARLGRSLPGT